MIESCANCGQDFLTEADPHLVIPSSKGYVLKCFCVVYKLEAHIKELEEKLSHQTQIMDAMTRTSQNNAVLSERLKVAVETMTVIKDGYVLPNGVLKKLAVALEKIGEMK